MAIVHFENTSQSGRYIMLRGKTSIKEVNGIEEEITPLTIATYRSSNDQINSPLVHDSYDRSVLS